MVSLWAFYHLPVNSGYRETDLRSLIELKDALWLQRQLRPTGTNSGKSNHGFALSIYLLAMYKKEKENRRNQLKIRQNLF